MMNKTLHLRSIIGTNANNNMSEISQEFLESHGPLKPTLLLEKRKVLYLIFISILIVLVLPIVGTRMFSRSKVDWISSISSYCYGMLIYFENNPLFLQFILPFFENS